METQEFRNSMTVTEALAEIKTLGKRIETKREFVRSHLVRHNAFRDPLEKDGGQVKAIEPKDFRATFVLNGTAYTLTEIKPDRPKYPFIGMSARGARYKFTEDQVKQGLATARGSK